MTQLLQILMKSKVYRLNWMFCLFLHSLLSIYRRLIIIAIPIKTSYERTLIDGFINKILEESITLDSQNVFRSTNNLIPCPYVLLESLDNNIKVFEVLKCQFSKYTKVTELSNDILRRSFQISFSSMQSFLKQSLYLMSTRCFESETLCHLINFKLTNFSVKILRINFKTFRIRLKNLLLI